MATITFFDEHTQENNNTPPPPLIQAPNEEPPRAILQDRATCKNKQDYLSKFIILINVGILASSLFAVNHFTETNYNTSMRAAAIFIPFINAALGNIMPALIFLGYKIADLEKAQQEPGHAQHTTEITFHERTSEVITLLTIASASCYIASTQDGASYSTLKAGIELTAASLGLSTAVNTYLAYDKWKNNGCFWQRQNTRNNNEPDLALLENQGNLAYEGII